MIRIKSRIDRMLNLFVCLFVVVILFGVVADIITEYWIEHYNINPLLIQFLPAVLFVSWCFPQVSKIPGGWWPKSYHHGHDRNGVWSNDGTLHLQGSKGNISIIHSMKMYYIRHYQTEWLNSGWIKKKGSRYQPTEVGKCILEAFDIRETSLER